MTLDELMDSNEGVWDKDVATVRHGTYTFIVATRTRKGEITLNPQALLHFPDLTLDSAPEAEANPTKAKKLTK